MFKLYVFYIYIYIYSFKIELACFPELESSLTDSLPPNRLTVVPKSRDTALFLSLSLFWDSAASSSSASS